MLLDNSLFKVIRNSPYIFRIIYFCDIILLPGECKQSFLFFISKNSRLLVCSTNFGDGCMHVSFPISWPTEFSQTTVVDSMLPDARCDVCLSSGDSSVPKRKRSFQSNRQRHEICTYAKLHLHSNKRAANNCQNRLRL